MRTGTSAHRSRSDEPGPAGILRSFIATVLAGGAGVALALVSRRALPATPTVEDLVTAAVTGIGALASSALALGSLLLLVTAAGRAAGRSWRLLEVLAQHLTPVVLRRAVAVTVTAGVLAAGPGVATAAELDLGWTVTTSTAERAQPASPDPETVDHAEASSQAPSEPGVIEQLEVRGQPGAGHAEAEGQSGAGRAEGTDALDSSSKPTEAGATDLHPAPAGSARIATVAPPAAGPVASTSQRPTPTDVEAFVDRHEPAAPQPPGAPVPAGTTGVGAGSTMPPAGEGTANPAAADSTDLLAAEARRAGSTVSVRPGDSLWSIAATHLPPGASDAEIAAAWPVIYAENRTLIGPDANLIHPGQVLTVRVPTERA